MEEKLIVSGNYVIVEKQSYRKLIKVTENGTFSMGKEQIEMKGLIGKPNWTTFHIKQSTSNSKKKLMSLEVAEKAESAQELRKTLSSGTDNRSITDDGTSQSLSKEDIADLRESGKSSNEILGRLIENSKSFAAKTEYSQDKYIKKKEKKYFRYLTTRKPTIDLLQEIYFKQDHGRISCLRADALSQILSYSDVKADGTYMLYDSGSMGLPASAMLKRIGAGTNGVLIHLHPGNQAQNTLIAAMNYPGEQLERVLTVNLYSFLRLHYQGEAAIIEEIAWKSSQSIVNSRTNGNSEHGKCKKDEKTEGEKVEKVEKGKNEKLGIDEKNESEKLGKLEKDETNESEKLEKNESEIVENNSKVFETINPLKRTREMDDATSMLQAKRPKWLLETNKAVEHCRERKVEGLVVIAKEHPLNIAKALLPFLGPSRPFVIYHYYREPLQDTYVALKARKDIINLKLLTNFLRSYQVLPNRTHPDILTSDLGGYLLTGYLVE